MNKIMSETTFTYILPGENNTLCSCNTETNSLIIIGANGSGKSKLGPDRTTEA